MAAHPLHDKVSNVSMRQAREAAVRVVDRLQDMLPEEQLVGLACLFHLVCERYDFEPRTAMEVSANVLRQAKLFNQAHFEGLKMYLKEEL